MILPRLIVADEIQKGNIPASLILIQAMRHKQIPVNVFFYGRSEEDLRLMRLLNDSPVSCLDTFTMGTPRNMKALFQRCASEKAVNIVSIPLGLALDEKTFQMNPEIADVTRFLDCGCIPVMSTTTAASVSATLAASAIASLGEVAPGKTPGIIFNDVKNPREFQLLEKELYRRTSALTLGFMPHSTSCSMPPMQTLNAKNPAMSLIPVKSASLQLVGGERQIEWDVLDGISRLDAEWTPPEPYRYQKKHLEVAVVGRHLSLEGEGNLEAFRMLGCSVYGYDHTKDDFPISADILYFPHTINEPHIEELLCDPKFRAGIVASFRGNKMILATGASSMLFGEFYRTADQRKIEGLRFFPYSGNTAHGAHGRVHRVRRVEARCIKDTCFISNNEKVRGYTVGGFNIANPGNLAAPCLSFRDMKSDVDMGLSGWTTGYCFVTDLRLDLWSALETMNHWLAQRSR